MIRLVWNHAIELHFDPAGLEVLVDSFGRLLREGRSSLTMRLDEGGLFQGRSTKTNEVSVPLSLLPEDSTSCFEKSSSGYTWHLSREDSDYLLSQFVDCKSTAGFFPSETIYIDGFSPTNERRGKGEMLYGFYDIPTDHAVPLQVQASPGWELYRIQLEQGLFGMATHEPGIKLFVKGDTDEEVLAQLREKTRRTSRNPYFKELFRKQKTTTKSPAQP